MHLSLSSISIEDKSKIHLLLLSAMQQQLEQIQRAAAAAHHGAVHADAVAKSKYDTHGLELSYLAGSQLQRALRLQSEIKLLKQQEVKLFSDQDVIAMGALVELHAGQERRFYWLSNLGSGLHLSWGSETIVVLSCHSPLGQQLLDACVGDEVELPSSPAAVALVAALV